MIEDKIISTLEYSKTFLEKPRYTNREFYQAINILSKYDYYIQIKILENLDKILKRNYNYYYYDINNFYYDFTNKSEDIGVNNDNDLMINYEIILDNLGFPVIYSVYDKNNKHKDEEIELWKIFMEKYKDKYCLALSSSTNLYLSDSVKKDMIMLRQ